MPGPKIIGLIFLGVALIGLLLTIGHSRPENQKGQQLKEATQGPGGSPAPIQHQTRSGQYKPDCSKKENAGLCAQMQMAEAADEQTLYTAIGLGLLAATLTAAFWAAWEARKAARAANDGAVAAWKAVNVTDGSAKAQLRAYITVPTSELLNMVIGTTIQAHVMLKNTGQTPAYDCFSQIAIGYVKYPEEMQDVSFPARDENASSPFYS